MRIMVQKGDRFLIMTDDAIDPMVRAMTRA
jgi:hypothetical protein